MSESHPLAGKDITLGASAVDPSRGLVVEGATGYVEDYWSTLTGHSVAHGAQTGNAACVVFLARLVKADQENPESLAAQGFQQSVDTGVEPPTVYVKLRPPGRDTYFGHLVWETELEDAVVLDADQ